MSDVIRLSTARNPLGLKIGERITFSRRCFVGYLKKVRQIIYEPEYQESGHVVGVVKKGLGRYIPSEYVQDLDGGHTEGAYLQVEKYVRLYEVRKAIDKSSFLVHPDNITVK